ncbi:MAG: alpha/beta hydrolase [Candidatus Binatia bacterium]
MEAVGLTNHDLEIEDVEYLRHGDTPLLLRLFKPAGAGPFPLIVELHGGAWCRGDRANDTALNEALAKSGVVVAALDWRMPPVAPYPASLTDINYAVRWLKARAGGLRSRPELVGIMGSSSGGHQAMLAAMRPRDPRYSALPLPAAAAQVDASVRCVVMCWPVIDPLGRYEYAKDLKTRGGSHAEFADRVLPSHDQFWGSEEAMAEGSPTRALERGEKVELPPALYIQGSADVAHPKPDRERFIETYRKAGGHLELELFEGEAEGFIGRNSNSPNAARATEKIIDFVHRQLG